MKRFLFLPAMFVLLPFAALAQKSNTVVVEIPTNHGATEIPLVRKGDGFVGPRGEYYPTFPSKKTLTAVYGNAPKSTPTRVEPSVYRGDTKIVVVSGAVNVYRDGRFFRQIRTKLPDVRGWKLIRDNTEVVVKSGVGREPGIVERFDVQSGKRLDAIRATDVKDGKPVWAKSFAE